MTPPQPTDALATVTVLAWVIPRPTGRWQQAIVVTDRHVWIMPELTIAHHEAMEAAAATGLSDFHDYLRGSGWVTRPDRVALAGVRSVNWDHGTGSMHIATDDQAIVARIANRDRGSALEPLLKTAIITHRANATAVG